MQLETLFFAKLLYVVQIAWFDSIWNIGWEAGTIEICDDQIDEAETYKLQIGINKNESKRGEEKT